MRPGEPYPATFQSVGGMRLEVERKHLKTTVSCFIQVDPPGIEPGFPVCRTGVFPLDHEPVISVDRMGIEPITPILQGSVASLGTCQPDHQRSVRESNPVPLLTEEVCCRNTYRPISDPGWNRTITFLVVTQASLPLDHGIFSDRGRGRTCKIATLST